MNMNSKSNHTKKCGVLHRWLTALCWMMQHTICSFSEKQSQQSQKELLTREQHLSQHGTHHASLSRFSYSQEWHSMTFLTLSHFLTLCIIISPLGPELLGWTLTWAQWRLKEQIRCKHLWTFCNLWLIKILIKVKRKSGNCRSQYFWYCQRI